MLQEKTLDSYNHETGSIVLHLSENARGDKEYFVRLYGHKENFTFECLSYDHAEKLFKTLYQSMVGYYITDDKKPIYRKVPA